MQVQKCVQFVLLICLSCLAYLLAGFGLVFAGWWLGIPALQDVGDAGLKVGDWAGTVVIALVLAWAGWRTWQWLRRPRLFILVHQAGEYGAGCPQCWELGIAVPVSMMFVPIYTSSHTFPDPPDMQCQVESILVHHEGGFAGERRGRAYPRITGLIRVGEHHRTVEGIWQPGILTMSLGDEERHGC